ncbi:hypothetical protein [Pseudonocardia alni]|uniref:hypothetical protein n=1 Tax=Pseudonocardia alni TaxID=33907 RepID=UPI0027A8299B|nr:hypothetical protein PaSha_07845 [Pseudonocardia alni]
MSGRIPVVGGLAGGVGTTTVARALHGRDLGRVCGPDLLPDVVVTRDTVAGLAAAPPRPGARAGRAGPRPAPRHRRPRRHRRRRRGSRLGGRRRAARGAGLGPLGRPVVGRGRVLTRPGPSAAVRRYADAIGRIVTALTTSGRLDRPLTPAGVGGLRPLRGVLAVPTGPVR